jgi:ADP-ribosyl-[dinitrogen reductase] hydrolase
MMTPHARAAGGFLGLALGDALGAQVEFKPRGSFPPVTEMVGGGVFNLRPGQITDDTFMALIMARSLIQHQGFHPQHLMQQYDDWSRGAFDVGNTITSALERFRRTREPFQGLSDPEASGNGSIMRLYPSVLWTLQDPYEKAFALVWDITRLTHASDLVKEVTDQMLTLIREIFEGQSKEHLLRNLTVLAPPESTGFVCDSFHVALWAFGSTDTFEAGLLKVVNLGGDADTAGAVYGQIAGSYYGLEGLPARWVQMVEHGPEIKRLINQLLK